MVPMCLYACLTALGHALDGVLEDLLLGLDHGTTELLDVGICQWYHGIISAYSDHIRLDSLHQCNV